MKYWGAEQEAAIVEFNTNEMVDIKHKIYNFNNRNLISIQKIF